MLTPMQNIYNSYRYLVIGLVGPSNVQWRTDMFSKVSLVQTPSYP
jgi:hypothetical protein